MTTALDELKGRLASKRELPSPAVRRALREGSGASLRDVGRAIEVSPTSVLNWERGLREPRAGHLERYLEVLRLFQKAAS